MFADVPLANVVFLLTVTDLTHVAYSIWSLFVVPGERCYERQHRQSVCVCVFM